MLFPQKCPFEAIEIINLPKNLERDTTHRYGPNSFKLHRLPMPRPGQVLGLVGTNGIGQLHIDTANHGERVEESEEVEHDSILCVLVAATRLVPTLAVGVRTVQHRIAMRST